MAKGLTDSQHYTDIAAAIRAKKGTSETLTPGQMAEAIESIESGLPSAAETTFGYSNNVPVERESNYSITSESLNNIAKRTQEMAGTSKLLTPDDIIYWLGRVMFTPLGNAESSFSLPFESSASGILPDVQIGTAVSEFRLSFDSRAVGELIPEDATDTFSVGSE